MNDVSFSICYIRSLRKTSYKYGPTTPLIIPVTHLFLANVWPWLTSRDVPVIPPLALQELIEALRKLGYRVDTPNNKLPALFHGKGPMRGSVTVSVEVGLVDLGGSWWILDWASR